MSGHARPPRDIAPAASGGGKVRWKMTELSLYWRLSKQISGSLLSFSLHNFRISRRAESGGNRELSRRSDVVDRRYLELRVFRDILPVRYVPRSDLRSVTRGASLWNQLAVVMLVYSILTLRRMFHFLNEFFAFCDFFLIKIHFINKKNLLIYYTSLYHFTIVFIAQFYCI